jgi:SPP1 family predicted phage head-tail adaptor
MTGAGQFDRRITIRRATVTANAFNEQIETWSDLATVWAFRRDASATERYRAQEVGAEISVRFKIRYSSQVADVNPRDRLVIGGREYDITRVTEPEGTRNRWRWIEAVARSDEAAEIVT